MKLLLLPVLLGVFGSANCENVAGRKPNLLQLAISLNLTEFVAEIKKIGADKVISHEGKFTIFAPSNEAFAREKSYPSEASMKEKLRFHVAWGEQRAREINNEMTLRTLLPKRTVRLNVYNGGRVRTANGRVIVSADHEAHNGIIHVLSDVMSSVYDREGSVVSELEECCPHHSRLMELIKKAGLYSVLDRRGPFTFFPPDNGAFAKLHPDYINHLVKNKTALRVVLLSHVVPGTVYSPGLKNGDVIKTLSGVKLCVGVKPGDVQIGTGKVQLMDVTAGNGAIHTLDTVQFPNQPTCETETSTAAELPTIPSIRPHLPDLMSAPKLEDWVGNYFIVRNISRLVSPMQAVSVSQFIKGLKVSGKTLLHQMEEDLSLTYFLTLIADTGLEGLFRQTNYPWTVFAPTNRALEEVFAEGDEPKISIAKLVMDHVLPETLYEAELRSESRIFTSSGIELKTHITDDGQISVNGVKVRRGGAGPAVNGVLFKVDELLA